MPSGSFFPLLCLIILWRGWNLSSWKKPPLYTQIFPILSVLSVCHMTQQKRLTICLKCRQAAWPGRSSRRGSNLKRDTREKCRHSEHYHRKDRGMCWLPPLPLDLIIWLKINRQMCVWEEEGDCLWELQSAVLLWFQDRSSLVPPTNCQTNKGDFSPQTLWLWKVKCLESVLCDINTQFLNRIWISGVMWLIGSAICV